MLTFELYKLYIMFSDIHNLLPFQFSFLLWENTHIIRSQDINRPALSKPFCDNLLQVDTGDVMAIIWLRR